MVNNWSIFNLFPNRCVLCDEPLPTTEKALCEPCYRQLPWLKGGCRYCANPLLGPTPDTSVCGRCQQSPPPFRSCHCLFSYEYPIDKLVTQLKFNQRLAYGRLLGDLLAESIARQIPNDDLPQVLIPVPLHRRRLRRRGFNQAYEIAKRCALTLDLPLLHKACRRTKDTQPQLDLDAASRRRNLHNAFSAHAPVSYTNVALVDDVITTGSTMRELSRILLKTGVKRVDLWCIARTGIE